VDHAGKDIPYTQDSSTDRAVMTFIADLPALGYQVYHLVAGEPTRPVSTVTDTTDTSFKFKDWRIIHQPHNGALQAIVEEHSGLNILAETANELLVMDDLMDAWGNTADSWRNVVGRFSLVSQKVLPNLPGGVTLSRILEFGHSRIEQDVLLHGELPFIPCRLRINWCESERFLKLSLPLGLSAPTVTAEMPYGCAGRPMDGMENPMQSWVDVSGLAKDVSGKEHPLGLAVLNDSKYGYDCLDGELRISLLRSPRFAGDRRFMDLGWHEINYALLPHRGTWQEAGIWHLAEELNSPPEYVWETEHDGQLPGRHSFARLDGPNVQWSVLKKHEDSNALIIRLVERHGQSGRVRLELPFLDGALGIEMAPYEIKTCLLSGSGDNLRMQEVNMLEDADGKTAL